MAIDFKSKKFREFDKKFMKIAPLALFAVSSIIVVVVVILSSHYAKKEIEQYSVKNSDLYTYIEGVRFDYTGKLTFNHQNEIVSGFTFDGVLKEMEKEALNQKKVYLGDYLLDQNKIKKIKLDIKENNKGSIKCAENAKYHFERSISLGYGETKILTYTKERK